jgi:ADP-ribose pyrophosphatase YjhB (NUDIX family)
MADESDDLTERIAWDGRTLTATWLAPPFRPDPQLTTQVLGFCCTPDGQILLVTSDDEAWTLPGGHPEPGETFEATLERELREEGCARLVACEYLGCQRVDDPQRPEGPDRYYQVRYWARIELYPSCSWTRSPGVRRWRRGTSWLWGSTWKVGMTRRCRATNPFDISTLTTAATPMAIRPGSPPAHSRTH